ncbi:hypothetical protein CRG98_047574 [Punica granatum]|uniref:Reverse transcriptase domain-containing protein n=1 Tax=Punica granatum TaxID=22663 RepID=A0A2I0HK16_PUNGR|nr:hypothetical protein CRG98_047574 [Punica granatum]
MAELVSPNQVLWNGKHTDSFSMGRGIRQGYPLSPYIFVLCLKRLAHLINEAVNAKHWVPMRVGRTGPLISHLMFADDLLLCSKASVQQMRVIQRIQDFFCTASGRKVSAAKSLVFFSKTVPRDEKGRIWQVSSFTAATSKGRYLGVPIVHGRLTKDHFHQVVSRVQSRLSGWSMTTLSMAGIVTLAQNLIWGHSEERRMVHLVRWEVITQPKECGGLGLGRLEEYNDALLAKLGCGFLTRPGQLWVRVLMGKYRNRIEGMGLQEVQTDSWLWKAITRAWNQVADGAIWAVGRGNGVRFWEDVWTPGGSPLLTQAAIPIPPQLCNRMVCEFAQGHGSWNWNAFSHFLDNEALLRVASIRPPSIGAAPDWLYLSRESSGMFSAISTYRLLVEHTIAERDPVWRLIWSWPGPQRVTRNFRSPKGQAKETTAMFCVFGHLPLSFFPG